MSSNHTLVTAKHFEYLARRTPGDDPFLRWLKREAKKAGIPPIWISPAQASFLQILLKAAGAKEVVEVGTLAGYSAIAMARALPATGRVLTIEIDPGRAQFSRRMVAASDVAERVKVLVGPAREVLATLADNSADAAFLDADKGGQPHYLRECLRIVRPGGLMLVDNAFAFGELFEKKPRDRETAAVRRFNNLMARTRELHSMIVPIGDGLWVGVRNR